MFEWLTSILNPHWVAILTSPAILAILYFPLLLLIAHLCSVLVEPVEGLMRKSPTLNVFIDKAIEKAPPEGWWGYIIAAVVIIFLLSATAWYLITGYSVAAYLS
ncbi:MULTISPECIES: hypothetical protein [Gordonibacter]|uniref:Uncharacterized protein n=1 Tax=Gordonibacter faecis TaxID=3047475 RepID=A0ABT7DQB4_9ACTN|nr:MULTISPECIES: hypothetical protein [unclassified Gordonibacter]MDJ1651726.1 hypothetical protein [Gordonibacter sp. KGMB12511]HIW75315.1 hypothetical protein [Candidatus Gordonibacter avicola]